MPTAVVTGGAGFLGSHLCDYLLEQGHRVICVDNLETGSLENIEHIRDDDFVFAEPRRDRAHRDRRGRSTSSSTSPRSRARSTTCGMPLHSLKTGSYGTHNALGLAKFKRARFLLASTSEVYGDPQVHPQPETLLGQREPDRPARRLRRGEALRRGDDDGLPPPAGRRHVDRADLQHVRPAHAPHDGRAIPTFVRQALENKPLTVFGDGSQTRSFCYVDDLIRGLYLLATSGEHLPVNLGNPGSSRCSSSRRRSSE